uniref:Adipokinetic prohormone type 3 n=1 Tax=Locusta migratoria TaxID=7004 RepID=AKH3_LOCMI|nr:RecName: Full=Adipokinetic prohormone type 3; Contains: RecName: Full=Adipokinetic hormone 3; AltName: Full=Adipokinetic hormone III; Short=AKH-III; Contains: RecName: Full=Adipokinetic hormone precursor-related peptide gamma chain; Short=APRP-gamma; Flags: Precursor [Locusta migratoria]CAA60496.1 adipokinetic hormone III, adipokinetic-hormone-associated peptide III [Locusta migratoria]
MQVRAVLVLAVVALVAVATSRAQLNFTPWWGKRALGAPAAGDCVSASPQALLSILNAAQAEVQKLIDCSRFTSEANS